jgi:putative DNA primase/helicase
MMSDRHVIGLNIINMNDVITKPIEWFWRGYIPRGRLTLVVGDPGVGKSWFTLALATHHALGTPLPGTTEPCGPGATLLIGAEDPLEDTVRPRLEALGAKLMQIEALRSASVLTEAGDQREEPFSLAEDMALLSKVVLEGRYTLVGIDPINAFLGTDLDSHRDTDIRSVLAPLAQLAERSTAAVVAVMHLNKAVGGKAIYRVLNSIGYVAAARSVLLVGQDSEDEDGTTLRHVVQIKNNLGPLQPPQSFDLARGALAWAGESTATAAALLGHCDDGTREAARELKEAILGALTVDTGLSGEQLHKFCRELGVSVDTGQRACRKLGLTFTKTGLGRAQTRWSRPV